MRGEIQYHQKYFECDQYAAKMVISGLIMRNGNGYPENSVIFVLLLPS